MGKLTIVYTIIILVIFNCEICSAQHLTSGDSIALCPSEAFVRWLLTEKNNNKRLPDSLIMSVILKRIRYDRSISDDLLIGYFRNNNMLPEERIRYIDSLQFYSASRRYLRLFLLDQKTQMFSSVEVSDSIKIYTYELIELLNTINEETKKIAFVNYWHLADYYFFKERDLKKSETYYLKLKTDDVVLYSNYDFDFYSDLYIKGSIGQIKCRSGNFNLINELRFMPSMEPRIFPTLKKYLEEAGGRCERCDQYFIEYPPKVRIVLPKNKE